MDKMTHQTKYIIDIKNYDHSLDHSDVRDWVTGIQIQCDRDFQPVYGVTAILNLLGTTKSPDHSHWICAILDKSDVDNALGYHDVTDNGNPLIKVFAGDDIRDGLSPSVTLSHEILETLWNPFIDKFYTINIDGIEYLTPAEVCDPCEDDSLGYGIQLHNGKKILVSDFVYPKYWDDDPNAIRPQLDYKQYITKSMQILSGGYLSLLKKGETEWKQVYGQHTPTARSHKKIHHRFNQLQKMKNAFN
jgi:hypothetical protein